MVTKYWPAKMLWECDMLSRYNLAMEEWRRTSKSNEMGESRGTNKANQKIATHMATVDLEIEQSGREWARVATLP
eukprot:10684015-Ditylum_brightwellii.AAC.1